MGGVAVSPASLCSWTGDTISKDGPKFLASCAAWVGSEEVSCQTVGRTTGKKEGIMEKKTVRRWFSTVLLDESSKSKVEKSFLTYAMYIVRSRWQAILAYSDGNTGIARL